MAGTDSDHQAPRSGGVSDDELELARQGRRERILDAALRVFVERGYLGTTMDDIGAAVSMRGPSLYNHVRSKQALLEELMTRSIERIHAGLDDAVASTADEVLRLRRAMEVHVRYHAEHRFDALLGSRELGNLEGPSQQRVLQARRAYRQSFRSVVTAGVDAGRFRVASVEVATLALLDLGTGVAVWYRPDGPISVDQLVYQYSDLAVRIVGASA